MSAADTATAAARSVGLPAVRPGGSRLRRAILKRLMAAGTWVPREHLAGLTDLETSMDDELADLVITGQIEHARGAGYRMPGGPLVRAAMAELQAKPDLRRSVRGRRQGQEPQAHLVLAVAERRRLPGDAMDSVVAYCIELPATDLAGFQRQAAEVDALLDQYPEPLAPSGTP